MKIVSHTTKNAEKREYLKAEIHKICPDAEIDFVESDQNASNVLHGAEIFLTYSFKREWWNSCESLKWIHIGGAGINHIKFPELVESKVIVTNSKGIHKRAMSEFALMAMLYFSQRLQYAVEWKRDRDWTKAKRPMTQESFTLEAKKVTIIGGGNVGAGVVDLCLKMGMRAFIINRTRRTDMPWQVRAGDFSDLDEAMGWGDFIIVCLPLTEETKECINKNRIALMSPGAVLINVARGGLVDESALAEALVSGKIGGSCLDVFETEPLPENSPLFDIPNLLMTPHISGNYPEYVKDVIDLFLYNLAKYLKGEKLANAVDWGKGY